MYAEHFTRKRRTTNSPQIVFPDKMKSIALTILLSLFSLHAPRPVAIAVYPYDTDDPILSYTVDVSKQDLQLFWKNDSGEILGSIGQLKAFVESKGMTLVFAMNGGMFRYDHSPQGLFIQHNKTLFPLDTVSAGRGNFYLQPNGVFFVTTDNTPVICRTTDFADTGNISLATQSGPMLVIDGAIHPEFRKGSENLNIRNGVGILPDNSVVFAMSKSRINFYDFATWFKNLGCKNALYLDGAISRTYLPEQNWIQTDGEFGILIGVTKPGTE